MALLKIKIRAESMGGNLERPVGLVKLPSYQLLAGKIGRQWQNCNVHLGPTF